MNTTKNNKKLAEFLGWKLHNQRAYINPLGENKYFTGAIVERGTPIGGLKFHTDWNWLMQVAGKIEEIETKDNETFTIDIYKDSVTINKYGKYNHEIIVSEGGTKLGNLYNACVKFTEWLNNNE